jgi:hypothetical protein
VIDHPIASTLEACEQLLIVCNFAGNLAVGGYAAG